MDRMPPKAMFAEERSITSEQQLLGTPVQPHDKFDRPKGAWKQTLGSTLAAIGELIGNSKLEAKGDKDLKDGLDQEDRGIRRDVGSRVA